MTIFKKLLITAALFAAILCIFGEPAQAQKLQVVQFAGTTVGQKLTNAQAACIGASVPCILEIAPELAVYAQGTLPTKCAQCTWFDYTGLYGGTSGASVVDGSKLAGTTLLAKAANCPAAGVCDFRGLGAVFYPVGNGVVTVNADQTFLFDPATKFQAGLSSQNILIVAPNGVVSGFTFDCTNQPSFSGIVVKNDPTKFYTNGQHTLIENVLINPTCKTISTITPLSLNSTSNTLGVAFLRVRNFRAYTAGDGLVITTSGTGFVNANEFELQLSRQSHGIHITGVASGAIQGNRFIVNYENDGVGINAILVDGSAGSLDGNSFDLISFDTTTPVVVSNGGAGVLRNTFRGFFGGANTDVNNANNFERIGNDTLAPAISHRGVQVKSNGANSTDTLDIFDITAAAPTPHKFIRVNGGVLQILNNAFSTDILDLDDSGKFTKYGSVATVGNGVPAIVAKLDLTQQTANLINQALYTVPATGAGFYRATCYIVVVQAATTSSTMPACQIIATDADTVTGWNNVFTPTSTTNTVGTTNSANVAVAGNAIPGTITFYAGASSPIQISTNGYVSTGGLPMKFTIHVKLEYLGN